MSPLNGLSAHMRPIACSTCLRSVRADRVVLELRRERPPVVVPRTGHVDDGCGRVLAAVVDALRSGDRHAPRRVQHVDGAQVARAIGDVGRPASGGQVGHVRHVWSSPAVHALVVAPRRAFDDAGELETGRRAVIGEHEVRAMPHGAKEIVGIQCRVKRGHGLHEPCKCAPVTSSHLYRRRSDDEHQVACSGIDTPLSFPDLFGLKSVIWSPCITRDSEICDSLPNEHLPQG